MHAGSDLRGAELSLRFGGGRLIPEMCFFEDPHGLYLLAITQTIAASDGSGELALHRISFAPPPTSAGGVGGQALSSWLDIARSSPQRAAASREGAVAPCVQSACAVSSDSLALGLSDESVCIATGDWHTGSLAPLAHVGEGGPSIFGLGRFVVGKLLTAGSGAVGTIGAAAAGTAGAAEAGWAARGEAPPLAGVVQIVAVEVRAARIGAVYHPCALGGLARGWASREMAGMGGILCAGSAAFGPIRLPVARGV